MYNPWWTLQATKMEPASANSRTANHPESTTAKTHPQTRTGGGSPNRRIPYLCTQSHTSTQPSERNILCSVQFHVAVCNMINTVLFTESSPVPRALFSSPLPSLDAYLRVYVLAPGPAASATPAAPRVGRDGHLHPAGHGCAHREDTALRDARRGPRWSLPLGRRLLHPAVVGVEVVHTAAASQVSAARALLPGLGGTAAGGGAARHLAPSTGALLPRLSHRDSAGRSAALLPVVGNGHH